MKSIKQLNPDLPKIRSLSGGITRKKLIFVTCLLLAISFSGLYLFLSPDLASQPWDSLAYAYETEAKGTSAIRGNHPLGHVIFLASLSLVKQFGYDGRALSLLQVINALLGGITIAAFFAILVSIVKVRRQYALGFSFLLGVSRGFWFFAGTAEIYHLSILFALLAWASLVYEIILKNRPVPFLSGILTGLSILFHQLNLVLVPVGLAIILLAPQSDLHWKERKAKQTVIFLATISAVVIFGYLLLGFIATSSLSLHNVIGWMQGYFGDPTYGRYLNNGVIKTAWNTIWQSVLFSPQNKAELISRGSLALLGLMMVLGLWFNTVLGGRRQAMMIASALQCLITWLLILWWEPQNPKFWLLTLVPWMILLALSFEAVETSISNWPTKFGTRLTYSLTILPLVMGILILSINAPYARGKGDSVAFNEAMDLWKNNSSPNDVLITAGDLIPHLRYWGIRPNTVFLYRSLQASQNSPDKFYDLRRKFNQALCAQRTVLITPLASEYVSDHELSLVGVSREELRSYLEENARRGEVLFWYRNVWDGKRLPVYALRGPVACSDQKSKLKLPE